MTSIPLKLKPLRTTPAKTRAKPAARASDRALTDEELLSRYRRTGDRSAFSELVHRYEGELYGYLRRYLGDAALAEDAFQSTFLQVHLKCDQYEEGRRVRPWLYTIATNQAIDAQRRNKRHRAVSIDRLSQRRGAPDGLNLEMSASEEAAGYAMERTEDRGRVRRAVSALPETLRCTVNLVYYQGLKYREAAEILEIPVGTVKSRLHAAVCKLNEMVHGDGPRELD
jgi:RNA polymerase sigma-70 factor (ECF subfamily)